MTYIEQLRLSKDKAQVAFQAFMLATRKYTHHLFCFFEGKDNPYYVPRIKRFTSNYQPIMCGNRDSVLKVYSLISNRPEYANYKKAFFIDRDFNEPLIPPNPLIFETPCYSVENLYVSVDVFKEILINVFHLSEFSDHNIFDVCIPLYQKQQEEFHNAVCLFNAWYACLIEIRNSTGKTTGVKLDEKLPKGFIEVTLQSVTCHYDIEVIKKTFPNATEIEAVLLNSKLEKFRCCEKKSVFRGKYEMQFLITFIQLLLQDSNSTRSIVASKINYGFSDTLSNQQALYVFEGYAETPESLIQYLESVAK
ncbi:MAG: DUF4435 domain-containing protein [Sphingobacteriales bacterium]|nr:DUF4435 domain-containing protein [Sphingobacteriales bacterium]